MNFRQVLSSIRFGCKIVITSEYNSQPHSTANDWISGNFDRFNIKSIKGISHQHANNSRYLKGSTLMINTIVPIRNELHPFYATDVTKPCHFAPSHRYYLCTMEKCLAVNSHGTATGPHACSLIEIITVINLWQTNVAS